MTIKSDNIEKLINPQQPPLKRVLSEDTNVNDYCLNDECKNSENFS